MKINARSFRLLTVLVVSIGGILILGCVDQSESTQDFLTYENPTHGIRIKYPKDWTMREGFMETTVMFFSPKTGENLSVAIEDISDVSYTLDEYTELALYKLELHLSDFTVVESGKTTLAGNSAYKIVFTGSKEQPNLKWMQIWTINDDMVYLITYTAEKDTFSDSIEIIEAMISSFEFT